MHTIFKIVLLKWNDILWNVVVPVLAGVFIYLFKYIGLFPLVIQNYFADAFWAYAFSSAILIIWDRKLNVLWMIVAFLFALFFELLQFGGYIEGTGDSLDVVVYALFFALAICLNKYFKNLNLPQTKVYE